MNYQCYFYLGNFHNLNWAKQKPIIEIEKIENDEKEEKKVERKRADRYQKDKVKYYYVIGIKRKVNIFDYSRLVVPA